MADYTRRERTSTWVGYAVPNPANWAEVGKIYTALNRELGEERRQWDDIVEVLATDEEIIFRCLKEGDR